MAKTAARKVAVAKRLYDIACGRWGLPPSALLSLSAQLSLPTQRASASAFRLKAFRSSQLLRDSVRPRSLRYSAAPL